MDTMTKYIVRAGKNKWEYTNYGQALDHYLAVALFEPLRYACLEEVVAVILREHGI